MEKAKHKNRIICFASIVLMMMIASMFSVAYAEDEDTSSTASIAIEGEHKVDNKDTLKTGRHTFILEAEDESYPMPKGSENGKKKVTISSNEQFSFGEMEFPKAGIYTYTVSREKIASEDLSIDESEYRVKIASFNDGTVVLVLEKKGFDGKPDKIEYVDTFLNASEPTTEEPTTAVTEPTTTEETEEFDSTTKTSTNKNDGSILRRTAKTGDTINLMLLAMGIIVSGGIAVFIVVRDRRRRNRTDNDSESE